VVRPESFFDLSKCEHAELFEGLDCVWEALARMPAYLERRLGGSSSEGEARVLLAPGAVVEEAARVTGPALIGAGARVYAGTLVRGPVILGRGAVVGRGSEVVRSILLDEAHVPHLNYVGDSILGASANLGAGAVCSNVKLDKGAIRIRVGERRYDTGMARLGAILGDGVEVGCNVVLNPGTLVGPGTRIYPGVSLRGYVPGNHIVKVRQQVEMIRRK
jgi:NDP-sugar pyrophosphorylase family protein